MGKRRNECYEPLIVTDPLMFAVVSMRHMGGGAQGAERGGEKGSTDRQPNYKERRQLAQTILGYVQVLLLLLLLFTNSNIF